MDASREDMLHLTMWSRYEYSTTPDSTLITARCIARHQREDSCEKFKTVLNLTNVKVGSKMEKRCIFDSDAMDELGRCGSFTTCGR